MIDRTILALFDRGGLNVLAENGLLLISDQLMRIGMCADLLMYCQINAGNAIFSRLTLRER